MWTQSTTLPKLNGAKWRCDLTFDHIIPLIKGGGEVYITRYYVARGVTFQKATLIYLNGII
jgi:hypothetical protein